MSEMFYPCGDEGGGGLNLISGRGDKNNNNINWRLVDMFDEFIADL
jgi:hypothetical protein